LHSQPLEVKALQDYIYWVVGCWLLVVCKKNTNNQQQAINYTRSS
jgi:hypothetical protein